MRRRLLIGLAVLAMSAGAAAPAQAFSAFTGDVTPGLDTATVYGYVDTSNVQTQWAFAYGANAQYTDWTSFGSIPAGTGTVMVAAVLTGLKPGTLYHYRLIAVPAAAPPGSYSYYATGDDQWFHTLRPRLELLTRTLVVRRTSSQVALECVNLHPCRGSLSLQLAHPARGRDASCGRVSLGIPAGVARTLALRLAKTCARQLRAAHAHRLSALITAHPDGRLPGFKSQVTLEAK